MKAPRCAYAASIVLALLGLPVGCGFKTGLALDTPHTSVGVAVFHNDSPERDIERELHGELTRSMRNLVDAPLVKPGQASLVMRGRILRYERRGGIRSPQNVLLETGLNLRVEAELWDRVRGERLSGPVTARAIVGYTLEDPGNELDARRRAVKNLADRLVLDLFAAARPGDRGPGPPSAAPQGLPRPSAPTDGAQEPIL